MKKWTQDDAVAFECAREVITDLMAIKSREIAVEEARSAPDADRLASLESVLAKLASERNALRGIDRATVAKIRADYGAQVRAYRKCED